MYEVRDKAFQDWALDPKMTFKKETHGQFTHQDIISAFNAGWVLRKQHDLKILYNVAKSSTLEVE